MSLTINELKTVKGDDSNNNDGGGNDDDDDDDDDDDETDEFYFDFELFYVQKWARVKPRWC